MRVVLPRKARGFRQPRQPPVDRGAVVLQHNGQEDGVCKPVPHVIEPAERVRDGVDVADARAREGEARLIRRGEHRLPRPEVPAVAADLRQVAEDSRDRPLGHPPRLGSIVEPADIGLDCVRQGVHARLCRHILRQARRERRVEHRRLRNQAEVIDGVFVVVAAGHDGGDRRLRAGARRRRHGDKRRHAAAHL